MQARGEERTIDKGSVDTRDRSKFTAYAEVHTGIKIERVRLSIASLSIVNWLIVRQTSVMIVKGEEVGQERY